ncbi:MAG: MBL fold metallo-hydrolase [Acidobacteriia bacterium]|nr:MBL fold metallo-hydrolase [Terriglobia bacterium]
MIENSNANMADLAYWGGNITFLVTSDGVLMVDAKFARAHDDVVSKIKSVTDKPIKYLVLTHNHGDHADGAQRFEDGGAQVIISADDRANMLRAANANWAPSFTYIGQARIFLGGKEVQLLQLRGDTRGGTVAYFPADRVISLGDLVTTAEAIPSIINYSDGGDWTDWESSMNRALALDWDTAIPGHGPAVTRQQVLQIRDKMVAIRERVRVMNREKKSLEEIQQTLVKEFNWGAGPAAGVIPGMLVELR